MFLHDYEYDQTARTALAQSKLRSSETSDYQEKAH